ncbi:hypothetical protein Pmani_027360 [Petrolisthes manimaculis]|uniref:Uncharacterized protein n=1 Tax=Petrolisthes manimaculis TaxID=1843537 RepID=A0AAE1P3Q0_9EUCA|nr:hypothetical protein Pmani_027360 [Petrolisthes manimaculis]
MKVKVKRQWACRLLLVYGSWLWTWVPPAAGVLVDLGGNDAGGGLDHVGLSAKEVQEAVREAVVVVREQIEVVEPHVFHNGGKLGPDSPPTTTTAS